MEPWQEEALHTRRQEQKGARLPQCHLCEEPVTTERYLEVEIFGAGVQICEECISEHMRHL